MACPFNWRVVFKSHSVHLRIYWENCLNIVLTILVDCAVVDWLSFGKLNGLMP